MFIDCHIKVIGKVGKISICVLEGASSRGRPEVLEGLMVTEL